VSQESWTLQRDTFWNWSKDSDGGAVKWREGHEVCRSDIDIPPFSKKESSDILRHSWSFPSELYYSCPHPSQYICEGLLTCHEVFRLDGGLDDAGFESLQRGFCFLENAQSGSVAHSTPSGAKRPRPAVDCHLAPLPKWRSCGAILLLHIHDFLACTGVNLLSANNKIRQQQQYIPASSTRWKVLISA